MNIFKSRQYQLGVGLIEILVVLVVIAVGVIAVLGLQGTLMSGSSTAKARNEAMSLAREKIEELRNTVELGQYDTDLAVQAMTDDPDGTIDGVNAQFTRRWSIAEAAGVEHARELVMQINWADTAGETNTVELNTLVAYASPYATAMQRGKGNYGEPARPGGTDTGYEGLHGETPIDETVTDSRAQDDATEVIDTRMGITDVLNYSNGHVQVRIPAPGCSLDGESDTDECACPLVDRIAAIGGGVDCVVFTAFGGTLLRFGGTVYVDGYLSTYNQDADFNEALLVKATSPAYCAHQRASCGNVDPDIDCVEYVCYVSGDCAKNTDGANGCPAANTTALNEVIARGLNGGWYGKIGHYFPLESSSNFPGVCMGREIEYEEGERELEDNRSVARTYYSERTDANGAKWREGINQSYLGHNTIIGDSSNYECDDGYEKLITEGIVWNSFVDPKVIRPLSANATNNVLDTDRTYDDLVAIYGSLEFPDHPPVEDNELVIGKPSGTFESLETLSTGAYADFVDGECVFQEDNKGIIIYACNYVNTNWASGWSWSGEITARGTMSYDVTNLDDGTIRSYVDRVCTVTNYYDSQPPERYSEDLPNEGSVISCE